MPPQPFQLSSRLLTLSFWSFLTVAVLFLCFVGTSGQSKPGPVLIDEFGLIGCEEMMVRLDNFYNELSKNAGSAGLIFMNGEDKAMRRNVTYEGMLEGWRRYRNFPQSIPVIRGRLQPALKIQLWKIPSGADKPTVETAVWSYVLPENTKPFVFYESSMEFAVCPPHPALKLYADFLAANPRARGNIVVRARSRRVFHKEVKEIEKTLVAELAVPRKQLKFFFTSRQLRNWPDPEIEYWIVP